MKSESFKHDSFHNDMTYEYQPIPNPTNDPSKPIGFLKASPRPVQKYEQSIILIIIGFLAGFVSGFAAFYIVRYWDLIVAGW